ncbi:hypothetical protein KL918_005174 [Ogataea parapolymorpha]|uniref:K Homology domain-containing protein n=1 Tax=Ogataea parapolymorpha (strain ATCC 26012 / BCRC 20466 / JCM 22074 / NRRL Y-7560 / DL-1) TaxID=871575 RepID=W1QCY6_OGAPD|nr:hypothetical protein HPODL_04077 [Ogataea parapolymorpha DL-1]ESW98450.1 hypothetical protein HPODL_04077 [Ogataea parapolymorpha DL-1]KAG7864853.1 hypothetical protein KL918_005174 [Ogataea parapolymorpha]KAG7873357.1 hypothetical protein KL916_002306 [Ogataea parapolymorpha]
MTLYSDLAFQHQPLQTVQAVDNNRLIVTIPFNYTHFVKPGNVLHESLVSSDWRLIETDAVSSFPFLQNLPAGTMVCDNLESLRTVVNHANERYAASGIMTILNEFRGSERKLTISIIGSYASQREMNEIRLQIFRHYFEITKRRITIDFTKNNYCFTSIGKIKEELTLFLDEVSLYNKCSIYIAPSKESSSKVDIVILGSQDCSTVAENKVRLFIDNLNPLSHCDYIEIESLSLLPLIGGTEFSNFKNIVKRTHCHIYLPNLTPELYFNNSLDTELQKPTIYITGLKSLVLLTKYMLSDIIQKINKTPFIKQLSVMPIKRESMILFMEDPEFLKNIMFETGCFISIPSLGFSYPEGTGDIISFQANSIEDVDNAIDKFMGFISSFYSAKYEFKMTTSTTADVSKLLSFNDSLSFITNSIVSLAKINDDYVFQVVGRSEGLKQAANPLAQFAPYLEADLVKSTTTYQIELSNKEKDFIAGKKNGKIIKIMNMSSVTIKLLPFTDFNFIVEITCADLMDSVLGLGMFEDELPSILIFNVPESFHRQIIGVGGQTVQTIMRKFNVFIKFSNSFELNEKSDSISPNSSNFPQSFVRKKNVIIKCPAKNKSQIPLAKIELEKLVEKVMNVNYFCSIVKLTRPQWRLLTSSQLNCNLNANRVKPSNFVTELEKTTNTFIKYPKLDHEEANQDTVNLEIYGIDNNSKNCCSELIKLLPYEYELKILKSGIFKELMETVSNTKRMLTHHKNPLQLEFLNTVMVPLKLLYNVELLFKSNKTTDSIILNFYPDAFGVDWLAKEKMNDEIQQEISKTEKFSQMLENVKIFLRNQKMEIISQSFKTCEFDIITPDQKIEKENVNSKKLSQQGLDNSAFSSVYAKKGASFQQPMHPPSTKRAPSSEAQHQNGGSRFQQTINTIGPFSAPDFKFTPMSNTY